MKRRARKTQIMDWLINQKNIPKFYIHQKEKVDFALKAMFGVGKAMKLTILEIIPYAMITFYMNFIITS
jgi:hypothetical protein